MNPSQHEEQPHLFIEARTHTQRSNANFNCINFPTPPRYNGRGPFIWQTVASDWSSYSRCWLVHSDPSSMRNSTCVCLS